MSNREITPAKQGSQQNLTTVYVGVPNSVPRVYHIDTNTKSPPSKSQRNVPVFTSRSAHTTWSCSDEVSPIHLSWENVNVHVDVKKKKCCGGGQGVTQKHILRNVTGLVKPGTLLAIIGASGAGKSTLMNVLTGRNTAKYNLEGKIEVNGVAVGKGIKNVSAYCQQDELFVGTLTVREHLRFRAMLRMDKCLTKKARLQRVEEVITEMGLTKCAETKIGVPGRTKGISGGEMKRLSFASEVLTNPPLMFCDEPTSGLDSFMAQSVVQTLHNMASKGRTILCTIHQPSSEVFATFDEVLVMAEGRIAYMGPASTAFEFFERLGYPCPLHFNPADFFILTLAIVPGNEDECRDKVEKIADAFLESNQYQQLKSEIKELTSSQDRSASSVVLEEAFGNDHHRYSTSWCAQFRAVFWRSWISVFRDVVLFRVRVFQTVVIAIILGLIYLRQTYNQEGVMNINGALFLIITNASFSNMFSVINSFPIELAIFMREYGSSLYRVDVYFLAKMLAELPTFILLPWLMLTVLYWLIGLYNDVFTYLICSAVVVLVANNAVSFGYLISTLAGSIDIALAIAPPLLIPFMLFGGLFLNNGTVPVYFIWLKYLSWFQYANEVLSVNQWSNVDYLECDVTPGNVTFPAANATSRCFRNGDDVLDYLNFSKDNILFDVCLLLTLMVGFRILAFLVLLLKARLSRS